MEHTPNTSFLISLDGNAAVRVPLMACVEKTQVLIKLQNLEDISYRQPGGDKSDGGQKLGVGCAAEREKLPKKFGDLQNAHKVQNLTK